MNKKIFLSLVFLFFLFIIPFVSSVRDTIINFEGEKGLEVVANFNDVYKTNEPAELHVYVFNRSSGKLVSSPTAQCQAELTDHNGTVLMENIAGTHNNHFLMQRPASVITEPGIYAVTLWCNTTDLDGYITAFFEANTSGEPSNSLQLYSRIFLIILLISGIIIIQWNRKRINYEQWYSKMATQYQEKNLFKWGLSALGYNLMKNSYIFSYLIGLFGMLVLTEITLLFNITSALSLMKIMLALYSWAALAVVIVFFSQVQEWFKGWIKDIQDLSWGWEGMA